MLAYSRDSPHFADPKLHYRFHIIPSLVPILNTKSQSSFSQNLPLI